MKATVFTNAELMGKAVLIALFCLTLIFSISSSSTTLAQSTPNIGDFISELQNGTLSIESAANQLAGATSFDLTEATELVENFRRMVDPTQAEALLSEFLQGNISELITQELSEMINLGELESLLDIERILNMPNIAEEIERLLEGANLGEVTELINSITGLLGGVEALEQLATQFGAEAIAGLLNDIAPELVEALGGEEAIANALNIAAGGAGIAAGGGGAPSGGDTSSHSCCQCQKPISTNHTNIKTHMTSEFELYRQWFVHDMFKQNILPAWQLMTTQLTAAGMMQVNAVGQFFDANHQLETQQLFQTLTAKAHKDYHPSESLCSFGTNMRSLSSSERKADLTHRALSSRSMQRQLSSGDNISAQGSFSDKQSRIKNFIKNYCDPTDNGNAFDRFCLGTSSTKERQNKDVNFTQTIENKLTLDLDFSDATTTDNEEDIIALSSNLFAHEVLPTIPDRILANGQNEPLQTANNYLDIRAIAAKRSVAQNSIHAITALKTSGDSEAAPYLYRIMHDLGIKKTELEDLLGENPSYFAQMEILTKNIYQNPNFYTDLYDKPANVERKGAALQAIALMQDRDTFDSLIRSEAALATLLETLLQKEHRRVSAKLPDTEDNSKEFGGGTAGRGAGGSW